MTAISELLPHQGKMVLIDTIVSCDENFIVCKTRSHQSQSNPLHNKTGLPISACLEYGAQALALHGIMNRSGDTRPKQASIIAIKKANWSHQWLHDIDRELIINAELKTQLDTIAKYAFSIKTENSESPIYQAEVSVSLS